MLYLRYNDEKKYENNYTVILTMLMTNLHAPAKLTGVISNFIYSSRRVKYSMESIYKPTV